MHQRFKMSVGCIPISRTLGGCLHRDKNPLLPFLMAETPIIKAGMNGFYPWANKEKKTDPKTLMSVILAASDEG